MEMLPTIPTGSQASACPLVGWHYSHSQLSPRVGVPTQIRWNRKVTQWGQVGGGRVSGHEWREIVGIKVTNTPKGLSPVPDRVTINKCLLLLTVSPFIKYLLFSRHCDKTSHPLSQIVTTSLLVV